MLQLLLRTISFSWAWCGWLRRWCLR